MLLLLLLIVLNNFPPPPRSVKIFRDGGACNSRLLLLTPFDQRRIVFPLHLQRNNNVAREEEVEGPSSAASSPLNDYDGLLLSNSFAEERRNCGNFLRFPSFVY